MVGTGGIHDNAHQLHAVTLCGTGQAGIHIIDTALVTAGDTLVDKLGNDGVLQHIVGGLEFPFL